VCRRLLSTVPSCCSLGRFRRCRLKTGEGNAAAERLRGHVGTSRAGRSRRTRRRCPAADGPRRGSCRSPCRSHGVLALGHRGLKPALRSFFAVLFGTSSPFTSGGALAGPRDDEVHGSRSPPRVPASGDCETRAGQHRQEGSWSGQPRPAAGCRRRLFVLPVTSGTRTPGQRHRSGDEREAPRPPPPTTATRWGSSSSSGGRSSRDERGATSPPSGRRMRGGRDRRRRRRRGQRARSARAPRSAVVVGGARRGPWRAYSTTASIDRQRRVQLAGGRGRPRPA
jgi:hypothetical protein